MEASGQGKIDEILGAFEEHRFSAAFLSIASRTNVAKCWQPLPALRWMLAALRVEDNGEGLPGINISWDNAEAHSHSAYGLVAAIVEIVSGKSYFEFVRERMFMPAGMTRTGRYGDRAAFTICDFAAGRGAQAVGIPNIPPNWGPTSWLVMGSAGSEHRFYLFHVFRGLEAQAMLLMNGEGRSLEMRSLSQALEALVMNEK